MMDGDGGRSVYPLYRKSTPAGALCAIYPPTRHLSVKVRVERFGGRPYWDLVE
jgi:hypothetical protein